jgi:hypothetical protein
VVRTLLVLAVGVALGYGYGYKDAKTHEKNIVERGLERVLSHAGGSARGKYDSDLDRKLDSAER